MDDLPQVLIVVPCYNEAKRLDTAAFVRGLERRSWLRVLFVDDGSTDGTADVLEQLSEAVRDRVQVLRLWPNRGKAEAVRLGLLRALEGGPEIVGYWDADLSTPLDELDGMVARFVEQGIRMVLGARVRLLGRLIERSAVRHVLGRVFATAASLVLRLPVYDTQCGAKLMRNAPEIVAALRDPFKTRWVFDVELLARLREGMGEASARSEALPGVAEHPLGTWRDMPGSKLRTTDAFAAALDLGTIALQLRKAGRK